MVPVIGFVAAMSGHRLGGRAVPNGGFVLGAILIVCLGCLVGLVLFVFRDVDWPEGTTLVIRNPLWTNRCDLANSVVWADSVPEYTSVGNGPSAATGRNIPRIRARDSLAGKQIRLRLHDPATRNFFAPADLHALADAIYCGRRPELQHVQVRHISAAY